MPLGLGLAVSNTPLLYRSRERWEDIYHALVGDVAQDPRADIETPAMLDKYQERVEGAFDKLRAELEAYRPEALVVVASDTGRLFGAAHVPQLQVVVGTEVWGTTHYRELGEVPDVSNLVTVAVHQQIAAWLADELTEEGFDLNISRSFKPLGEPENGAPQSLFEPYIRISSGLGLPIVPLFVNAHVQPSISGHRIPPLGRAIAKVLSERPERIAILGVGGLTGDPGGYLAGWIDELLDDWILSRLQRGRTEQLKTLWDVESITLRGATREVRNWMIVGAAMEASGARATVVDYLPLHHAAVGTAFAFWRAP